MQTQLQTKSTRGTMQMVSVEVIMPVMDMVMVTDSKVIMEMHTIVGIERIIAHSQVEVVMRKNTELTVIACIIEIPKVIMAIARPDEPMHMKPSHINNNSRSIPNDRSMYDNGGEEDTSVCHLIIPISIHEDMTTGSPDPMRRSVYIVRTIPEPVPRTPAVTVTPVNPNARTPEVIIVWSGSRRPCFQRFWRSPAIIHSPSLSSLPKT